MHDAPTSLQNATAPGFVRPGLAVEHPEREARAPREPQLILLRGPLVVLRASAAGAHLALYHRERQGELHREAPVARRDAGLLAAPPPPPSVQKSRMATFGLAAWYAHLLTLPVGSPSNPVRPLSNQPN
jgi:hypothetical protein